MLPESSLRSRRSADQPAGRAVLRWFRGARAVANLTMAIDDEAPRRARIKALKQGVTVNGLLRDYLEAYAGDRSDLQRAWERTLEISRESKAGSGGHTWTRDELHERG